MKKREKEIKEKVKKMKTNPRAGVQNTKVFKDKRKKKKHQDRDLESIGWFDRWLED